MNNIRRGRHIAGVGLLKLGRWSVSDDDRPALCWPIGTLDAANDILIDRGKGRARATVDDICLALELRSRPE